MHDSPSLSTPTFAGLVVAAFESRRCEELARMIEKFGGVARVSPSMRESKLADSRPAVEFAHRVLAGQIDAVIFLTGVGTQMLLEQVERHVDRQRLLDALADIPTSVPRAETGRGAAKTRHHADATGPRTEHVARSAVDARRQTAAGESDRRPARVWRD